MSTVLVAAVLVGLLVLFTVLFTANENRKKRARINHYLTRFRQLGSLNNLAFSSQEILKDAAIGLDGVHRKVVVLTGSDETAFGNRLLSLADVKSCSVKKQYGATGLKKNEPEHHLKKIVLRFEFKNDQEPLEVIFFHHITNDVYERKEMIEKVKHWEIILSKMLKSSSKETA